MFVIMEVSMCSLLISFYLKMKAKYHINLSNITNFPSPANVRQSTESQSVSQHVCLYSLIFLRRKDEIIFPLLFSSLNF